MAHPQPPTSKNLLSTPPMPEGLPQVDLSENSYQVLTRRYIRKGDNGELIETPEEMFWRVAFHVAKVEEIWGEDVEERASVFYRLLAAKRFFPNSPTFTGAGTPLGQLAACFVLPISDDMGRRSDGIFQTLRDAALIQQTGGGNGFSFSSLRPRIILILKTSSSAKQTRTRLPTSTFLSVSLTRSCAPSRTNPPGNCVFLMFTIPPTGNFLALLKKRKLPASLSPLIVR
jgi:ribonucleoside-diphosphate reductase alpha chain